MSYEKHLDRLHDQHFGGPEFDTSVEHWFSDDKTELFFHIEMDKYSHEVCKHCGDLDMEVWTDEAAEMYIQDHAEDHHSEAYEAACEDSQRYEND